MAAPLPVNVKGLLSTLDLAGAAHQQIVNNAKKLAAAPPATPAATGQPPPVPAQK
jgi:hypothetical protein